MKKKAVEEILHAWIPIEGEKKHIPMRWRNWMWETLDITSESNFKRVFFLGARYSYWGNLVKPIAEVIYRKTNALIYAAKCGTLKSAARIETIVVPDIFATVSENNHVLR